MGSGIIKRKTLSTGYSADHVRFNSKKSRFIGLFPHPGKREQILEEGLGEVKKGTSPDPMPG